jgi:predicted transcriptional regulator
MLEQLSSIKNKTLLLTQDSLCETVTAMRLGAVLRKWRTMEERTIREVANEIGTSSATLLRIEQGKPCDSGTMATILLWLIGKEKK